MDKADRVSIALGIIPEGSEVWVDSTNSWHPRYVQMDGRYIYEKGRWWKTSEDPYLTQDKHTQYELTKLFFRKVRK